MNSGKTENSISVSLVDYIGKIDDGVAVILSLMINSEQYEMVYWFNRENNKHIKIEKKFYEHYPAIKDIYDYEYLIDLLYHIDTNILPNKEEIFSTFNV